jgi:hypothetical protein
MAVGRILIDAGVGEIVGVDSVGARLRAAGR